MTTKQTRRVISFHVYAEELDEIDSVVSQLPLASRNSVARLAVQLGMERIRDMPKMEALEALGKHDAIKLRS